jgi:hypothetical protein
MEQSLARRRKSSDTCLGLCTCRRDSWANPSATSSHEDQELPCCRAANARLARPQAQIGDHMDQLPHCNQHDGTTMLAAAPMRQHCSRCSALQRCLGRCHLHGHQCLRIHLSNQNHYIVSMRAGHPSCSATSQQATAQTRYYLRSRGYLPAAKSRPVSNAQATPKAQRAAVISGAQNHASASTS